MKTRIPALFAAEAVAFGHGAALAELEPMLDGTGVLLLHEGAIDVDGLDEDADEEDDEEDEENEGHGGLTATSVTAAPPALALASDEDEDDDTEPMLTSFFSAVHDIDSLALDYDEAVDGMRLFDEHLEAQLLDDALQQSLHEQMLLETLRTTFSTIAVPAPAALAAPLGGPPSPVSSAAAAAVAAVAAATSLARATEDEHGPAPTTTVSLSSIAGLDMDLTHAAPAATQPEPAPRTFEAELCERIVQAELPRPQLATVLRILRSVSRAFDDLLPHARPLQLDAVQAAVSMLPQAKLLRLHELVSRYPEASPMAPPTAVPKSVRMNSLSRSASVDGPYAPTVRMAASVGSPASPTSPMAAGVLSSASSPGGSLDMATVTPSPSGRKGMRRSVSATLETQSAPASPARTPARRPAGKLTGRKGSSAATPKGKRGTQRRLVSQDAGMVDATPVAVLQPLSDLDSDEEIDVVG